MPDTQGTAESERSRVPPIDWNALRSLDAMARFGSAVRASRAKGIALTTVVRQIRHLEDLCGDTLVDKTPSGLRLNERGRALAGFASAFVRAAHDLTNAPASSALSRRLRVAVTGFMEHSSLTTRLVEVASMNGLGGNGLIETIGTDDVVAHDADVLIAHKPRPVDRRIEPLGSVVFGLFASTSLLDRHRSDTIEDILGRDLVVPNGAPIRAAFFREFGDSIAMARIVGASDNGSTIRQVAQRGAIGLIDVRAAEQATDLFRVMPTISIAVPLFIATPRDTKADQMIDTVFEQLAALPSGEPKG